MKRKTVKRIFIASGIFLILQYAAVGIIGYFHSEPWPAFVFPGFKNVHVIEESFEVTRVEFHLLDAGSERVIVTPQHLFSGIPDSQLPGFLRTRFGHGDETLTFTNEARYWLKEQAVHATGMKPEQLMIVELKHFYSHKQQKAVLDSVLVENCITFDLTME